MLTDTDPESTVPSAARGGPGGRLRRPGACGGPGGELELIIETTEPAVGNTAGDGVQSPGNCLGIVSVGGSAVLTDLTSGRAVWTLPPRGYEHPFEEAP